MYFRCAAVLKSNLDLCEKKQKRQFRILEASNFLDLEDFCDLISGYCSIIHEIISCCFLVIYSSEECANVKNKNMYEQHGKLLISYMISIYLT